MSAARRLCAAAIALLLAGCASIDFQRTGDNVVFELAGRFAVKYRDEAASGSVAWRHVADSDEMLLS